MLKSLESISIRLDRPFYLSGEVVTGTVHVKFKRFPVAQDGETIEFYLKFSAEMKIRVVANYDERGVHILEDSVENLYEDKRVVWVYDANTPQVQNVQIRFTYPLPNGLHASIDVPYIIDSNSNRIGCKCHVRHVVMAGVEHSKDHQIRWDKDNATSILVYDQSELLPQIAEELGTARQLQFYNNSLFRNYVFDADQECEFTASVGQHFYQIGGTIRCIIAARNRNYRIFLEYCPFEEQKEYYGIFATINGL